MKQTPLSPEQLQEMLKNHARTIPSGRLYKRPTAGGKVWH